MTKVEGVLPPGVAAVGLGARAAQVIVEAKSVPEGEKRLGELVRDLHLTADRPGAIPENQGPALASSPASAAGLRKEALKQQVMLERRLELTIRALRREASKRGSKAAKRVLANNAIRLFLEVEAWRHLTQGPSSPAPGLAPVPSAPPPTTPNELAGRARQIRHAVESATIQTDAPPPDDKTVTNSLSHLNAREATALVEMLASADPQYGSIVRQLLAEGVGVDAFRDYLFKRLTSVLASPSSDDQKAQDDGSIDSFKFDLATNTWVPTRVSKHRSWVFSVRLTQLIGFEVDGVINGRKELTARLLDWARDPGSSGLAMPRERIEHFVEDLCYAARADDPKIDRILNSTFDFYFLATNGGDKPEGAYWEFSPKIIGELFAFMEDDKLMAHLADVAGEQRSVQQKRVAAKLKLVRPVLKQYPTQPQRHRRAHWALVNLGTIGQSVFELGKETGALPRSDVILEPETLKTRYAGAQDLKLRFTINDQFDICVLSDEDYNKVFQTYGFPPNHEVISFNRPILAIGYVTVDHGRIVGIEDDSVMVPGKLPAGLPPALELFKALQFDLDEQQISETTNVLDWNGFAKVAKKGGEPSPPSGDLKAMRQALIGCSHADRPGLLVAVLRKVVANTRAELPKTASPEAVVAAVTPMAAELLADFHLINTGIRAAAQGEIPWNADEIDSELAACLVKKVVTP